VTDSATRSTPINADSAVVKIDRRAISLLALGHLADDINQSFLPALLPLLVLQRHLSYQSAASLVLAQAISSSVVQPAIGFIADKYPMPWIAGLGLLLAGFGIAGIGFVPSYALIFVCALISGLGVAMFHPEAARFANLAAGSRKASGMRWFAVGGNLGFAIGPIFATIAIASYGMSGTFLAAIPVAVMAALLLRETARLRTFLPQHGASRKIVPLPDDWSAFGRLTLFITVRSTVYIGLVSFIPLYLVGVAHAPPWIANTVLTTFLLAGIVGTIIGGSLADTFGRLKIIQFSMIAAFLCMLLFAQTTNAPSAVSIAAAFVCAIPLGFTVLGSQAASIVLGQEYLPNRLGVASGVTLGLGVSVGGMFTPVLGRIADRSGLHASLLAIAAVVALSLAVSLTLPNPEKRRAKLLALSATGA
jgi:FSR family fosmidomycin resistance protein-like MFS transporter